MSCLICKHSHGDKRTLLCPSCVVEKLAPIKSQCNEAAAEADAASAQLNQRLSERSVPTTSGLEEARRRVVALRAVLQHHMDELTKSRAAMQRIRELNARKADVLSCARRDLIQKIHHDSAKEQDDECSKRTNDFMAMSVLGDQNWNLSILSVKLVRRAMVTLGLRWSKRTQQTSICGLILPSFESWSGLSSEHVTAALAATCRLLVLCARYLGAVLPKPIVFQPEHATITDEAANLVPLSPPVDGGKVLSATLYRRGLQALHQNIRFLLAFRHIDVNTLGPLLRDETVLALVMLIAGDDEKFPPLDVLRGLAQAREDQRLQALQSSRDSQGNLKDPSATLSESDTGGEPVILPVTSTGIGSYFGGVEGALGSSLVGSVGSLEASFVSVNDEDEDPVLVLPPLPSDD